MQEKYFYHREWVTRSHTFFNGGKRIRVQVTRPSPVATVCLLTCDNGESAIGVALCSPRDQFCKRVGRAIAFQRAKSAISQRRTFGQLPWHHDSRRPHYINAMGVYGPLNIETPKQLRARMELSPPDPVTQERTMRPAGEDMTFWDEEFYR